MTGQKFAMDPKNFDLNLLKVVLAIAQHGTVSKASDHLNVTQPAVSNALARLRQITDDPIFIRSRNGQVPTEYGKALIELGQNIMAQVRSCAENMHEFDPLAGTRQFRIAIDDFLESTLVPHFMRLSAAYHDNMELRFLSLKKMDIAEAMEADEIDLCINTWVDEQEDMKRIIFTELMTDPICVAISKSHPSAGLDRLTRADFLNLKYIIVRPDYRRYQMPELQLRGMGIQRHIAIQASRANSLPAIAAEGHYAITVPRLLFGDLLRLYDLKTFDMPFDFKPVSVVAGHHIRDEKNPAIKWLIGKFKEAAANLTAIT